MLVLTGVETDFENSEGQQGCDVTGDHGADDTPTATAIETFVMVFFLVGVFVEHRPERRGSANAPLYRSG